MIAGTVSANYSRLTTPPQNLLVSGRGGCLSNFIPPTKWAWIYLISSIVFNSAIIAIESVVFAWFQEASENFSSCTAGSSTCSQAQVLAQTTPIYLALFLFAGVYQVLVGVWALNQRNTIQLLFLVFFSVAMLVYSGIQYDQISSSTKFGEFDGENFVSGAEVKNLLIAVPCIIGGECLVQGFLTYRLYRIFNWDIFKNLGAGLRLKEALRDYLMFEAIILFDLFFFVGFTLQFVIVVLQTKDVEFALTIAVLPITVIVLVLAIISVRREIKLGVQIFIFLCFPATAYFLFKLIRLYTATGPKKLRFDRSRKTLTVFAVITLLFLILTILYSVKCLMNFGLGLKDRKKAESHPTFVMNSIDSGMKEESTGPRMVID